MSIIEDLEAYIPFNEQEETDKDFILQRLKVDSLAFDRSSVAHMTCSIWTVDPTLTKTLLVFHNIYNSWSWIGGHADGESDLKAVALRELLEETGIADARIANTGPGSLFSCEVLTVNGHEKRGRYIGSHLHMNVTYLAIADTANPLQIKPDENSGVQWVSLEEVVGLSDEPWIRNRIYSKLIEKTRQYANSIS